MLRPRFESGATIWETRTGCLKIEIPRPHVGRVTFRGHFSDEFVDPILANAERLVMSGRPALAFHDWERMTNYDIPARARMVTLGSQHLAATDRIHFLADSTVVRVAIEIANLALRKLEIHRMRRSFEEAYARALDERSSAPPAPVAAAR